MKRERTDAIVLCCTDTGPEMDWSLKQVDLQSRSRGWFRCVCHFVIKRDGEIEHGPRHYTEPAMALGRDNAVSVAVCLVGGKGEPPFTRPQLASLKDLLAELQDEYPDAVIKYHHEIDPKVAHHGLDLVALGKDLCV